MVQHQLIEACKNNSRRAQLKLYNKYCEGMYHVAFRFMKDTQEAEDAMQEAFIKAFAKLHQFSGEVTFGAWLKKIVIHKCLDKLKAKKLVLVDINEQILGRVEEDEHWNVSDTITVEDIKNLIAELPEKYRYPLMLFLMEGYDHEEISEILAITQVASRTLIYRGKKKLQEKIRDIEYYSKQSDRKMNF